MFFCPSFQWSEKIKQCKLIGDMHTTQIWYVLSVGTDEWAKVGEIYAPNIEFKFWWKIAIKMHDMVNLFFDLHLPLSRLFQKLTFLFSANKLQSNTLCNNGRPRNSI